MNLENKILIVDLINDEGPLLFKVFSRFESSYNVKYIVDDARWKELWGNKTNVISRSDYLEDLEAKDIDLHKNLSKIEATYDTNNIYLVDRYTSKKSRDYQIKYLVYNFLFYEDLFHENANSHYFTTGIAFMYNFISFEVTNKKGIKHFSFHNVRFSKKTTISLDKFHSFSLASDYFKETFENSVVDDSMLQRVFDFRDRPFQPAYMRNVINDYNPIKIVFLKEFFIRFYWFFFKKKSRFDLFTKNPFELVFVKMRKGFFGLIIDSFDSNIFDQPCASDQFYLFPLHMQPEASTLVLGSDYINQIETIRRISKVIPIDSFLYVKEHKSALGQNNIKFYCDLTKIPNVKLISHKVDTFKLIEMSKGIITISSTVGLEGLLLRKPVFTIGKVFYNASNLSIYCKSINELNFNLRKKIILDPLYDNKLAYFLHCIIKYSGDFEFNVAKLDSKKRVLQEDNIDNFFNYLQSILDD